MFEFQAPKSNVGKYVMIVVGAALVVGYFLHRAGVF